MSAGLALQKAVYELLMASDALKATVGNPVRLYDQVPAEPIFPYITFGDAQELEDEADCIDGTEHFLDLHVWSQARGRVEAKAISGVVREELRGTALTLDGHAFCLSEVESTRHLKDPDGATAHSILTFRVLTEAE